ncbi:hypothetical protein D918_09890 [Trichuris suis]|nr:hypothetical protein D918_09890 [Trichuris suis]
MEIPDWVLNPFSAAGNGELLVNEDPKVYGLSSDSYSSPFGHPIWLKEDLAWSLIFRGKIETGYE